MPNTITIPDALQELTTLVSAGEVSKARRKGRELLKRCDWDDLQLIAECVKVIEARPRTAYVILCDRWNRTDSEHDKAIIAACTPGPDYQPAPAVAEPERSPRWTRERINYARRRANGNVRSEVRPELRRHRNERQRREEARPVTEYHETRAGVDDQPEYAPRPDGYTIDYDRAAVHDLFTLACAWCSIERSRADQSGEQFRAGHGDDGLCEQCRETGHPGVPELPKGHTRQQAITARCAHLSEQYPDSARDLLRRDWFAYPTTRDRSTVAEWVSANLAPKPSAPSPKNEQPAPKTDPQQQTSNTAYARRPVTAEQLAAAVCTSCGGHRQVRLGLCLECRHIEPAPTTETPTMAPVTAIRGTDATPAQREPAAA